MSFIEHVRRRIGEIENALFFLKASGKEFPLVEESLTNELTCLKTILKEEEARQ